MIYVAFLLTLAGLFGCSYIDYRDRTPFFFVWPLLFLFSVLPVYVSWVSGYAENVVLEALTYVFFCSVVYAVSILFMKVVGLSRQEKICVNFDHPGLPVIYIWIALALILGLLVANGISYRRILGSTLSDKRELGVFYIMILYLVAFASPYVIYSWRARKWVLLSAVMFVYVLILLYFRSRSILSFMMLPIAYYVLFHKRHGFAYLVLIGGGAYLASQVVKVVRYQGELSSGLSLSAISDNLLAVIRASFDKGTGDFAIGTVFLDVVRDCQVASWCGQWTFVGKLFEKFLPLDGYSVTVEYWLWDYYFGASNGGSLHATGYGTTYADAGGHWGVVFFFLLAVVRCVFDRIVAHINVIGLLGFCMYFILFFSRGSIYNGFVTFVFSIFLVVLYFSVRRLAFFGGKHSS